MTGKQVSVMSLNCAESETSSQHDDRKGSVSSKFVRIAALRIV